VPFVSPLLKILHQRHRALQEKEEEKEEEEEERTVVTEIEHHFLFIVNICSQWNYYSKEFC
jgi:hypothetical protein